MIELHLLIGNCRFALLIVPFSYIMDVIVEQGVIKAQIYLINR